MMYAAPAGSASLAKPAAILLKIAAVLTLVQAFLSLITALLPGSIIGGIVFGCIGLLITFPMLLVALAGAIVYLLWQYRAYTQVRAAGATTTYTPGWSVGWLVIPIANIIFSKPILVDLWIASGATATPAPTSSIEQSAGGRPTFAWYCLVGGLAIIVLAILVAIIGVFVPLLGRLSQLMIAAAMVAMAGAFFTLALFTQDVQRALPQPPTPG